MSNSNHSDLMSIGEHCAVAGCGQRDFLPFKCDCCAQTFCLEHRTYTSHSCPVAGGRSTEAIVCPLCARAVKIGPGQDANEAFEQHQWLGCDTSNYNRVHKKPVCPVEGCRKKLTSISTYQCKTCHQSVCLDHRHEADHGCEAHRSKQFLSREMIWRLLLPWLSCRLLRHPEITPINNGHHLSWHNRASGLRLG